MKSKQISLGEWFEIKAEIDFKFQEILSKELTQRDISHKFKYTEGNDSVFFFVEVWLPNATEVYNLIKNIAA